MLLNFLDLDINNYSCHCDIGHNGIESAYFDFGDFVNISSASQLTLNRLQQLISYPNHKSFVQACKSGYFFHWFNNWASFSHSVGSESILRKNFSSSPLLDNTCGPVSVNDISSLNGLVSDSWTFKKYIYTSLSGDSNTSFISCPVYWDGSYLLANFLLGYFNDTSDYRKFKFYVDMRQVVDFPVSNCFIKVLYHRYDWSNLDEYNEPFPKVLNTIVISEFQVINGDVYCLSYSGNKFKINRSSESGSYPLLFDFYDFYYDKSDTYAPYEISVDDLNEHEFNVFKKNFGFEVLIYGDDSMSQLDCECLTNAINSLNSRIDTFNKSFTEAFNKVPISEQYSFGSGSVFKSNDLDNYDYYYLIDNKGKTCLSPIFIDKCDSDDLGSTPQKPLYITNTDTKGSSCNNPLYLNLCEMPAIKINDLFNRIDVGSIDINSLPLDYTSLISSLLGSIITALGNLLKPSDTLTISLPNIQISNMPSIDINSMPNINISNTSSSPVNISLTNGLSCNDPLHVDLCPFTFSEVPVRINSIPGLDVDIDTMPTTRLVTHANNAVDISCICNELDDIDKGLVAEFAALGVSLGSIKNAVDGVANKFVTSCDTSIGEAFSEAFNLTNCVGSVFKANDNNWVDEDTLAGIWYKQLDYFYLMADNTRKSAFWLCDLYNSSVRYVENIMGVFKQLMCNGVNELHDGYSVFKTGGSGKVGIANYFKRAFFVTSNNYNDDAGSSVFSLNLNSNFNIYKILNHACNVNPCSVKFCDNSLPVDIVNPSNNPVKVEMEPTSSTINVNVESAPADGDSIFINADGKTLLNTSNFK